MDQRDIDSVVERRIREAQERGDFDDLPGAGKPLAAMDRPYTEDWWIRGLIEREQLDVVGAMSPTMALRREAAQMQETVRDVPREEGVREIVTDYNRRVRLDRLRPAIGPQMPPIAKILDVDLVVEQWRVDQEAARAAAPAVLNDEQTQQRSPWWRRLFRRRDLPPR